MMIGPLAFFWAPRWSLEPEPDCGAFLQASKPLHTLVSTHGYGKLQDDSLTQVCFW